MIPNPITIGPKATGAEAEALMEAHRIRHLPVVAENLLVGMITDRDIRLASMPRPRKEPKRSDALLQLIRVEQLMTRDLVTVTPVTLIGEAARLMLERGPGALPVLESERLVGIISQGDLLKALISLLKSKESQDRGMPGKRRRLL
jgi:acetoin utilization protein AcuB